MPNSDDGTDPKSASTAEDTAIVPVAAERLARLRRAVTMASEGAFTDAAQILGAPQQDEFGEVEQSLCSFITELRLAIEHNDAALDELKTSKLELQQKLVTIERQQAAIQELSAPIIDVWDRVLTIPLTGLFDSTRAQELTERLLARIGQASVAWVILDLTGIESVDTSIASHLINLASAVRLMGAECLLTGIGPSVAQTFVSLGVEMEGLRPMPNLREGLKYCLAQQAAPSRKEKQGRL
jgi:rsbT co-antagonist protein RsbR